jgi:hypothetical protein
MFLSTDPVRPGASGVVGYNQYSYVGNNPTTWTDPSGRFSMVETGVLLRIIAVVAFSAACLAYCTPAARGLAGAIMALTQALQDTLEDLWNRPTVPDEERNPPRPQRPPNPNPNPRPIPDPFPLPKPPGPGDDDPGGPVTSYRGVDGNAGCQSGLSLSASAFRVDSDGVSTFERPDQGTFKPCLVPFTFSVSERVPGATAPVDGLPGCASTYTPGLANGLRHWSIQCIGDTAQILSTYAKAARDAGRIQVNELYGGG